MNRFAKILCTAAVGIVATIGFMSRVGSARASNVPIETNFTVFAYTSGQSTPMWHSPVLDGTNVDMVSENGFVYYKWTDSNYRSMQFVFASGFSALICEDRDND